jgi:hypothetical protein
MLFLKRGCKMLSIVKHKVAGCRDMIEWVNGVASNIKEALTSEEVFSNTDHVVELYTHKIVTVVPAIPKLKGVIRNRVGYDESDWNEGKKICDLKEITLKLVELKDGFTGWIILRRSSFIFTIIRDRNSEIITTKPIWEPSVLSYTEDAYSGKKYIMAVATTLWALQNLDKVIYPTPSDLVDVGRIENEIRGLKGIKLF